MKSQNSGRRLLLPGAGLALLSAPAWAQGSTSAATEGVPSTVFYVALAIAVVAGVAAGAGAMVLSRRPSPAGEPSGEVRQAVERLGDELARLRAEVRDASQNRSPGSDEVDSSTSKVLLERRLADFQGLIQMEFANARARAEAAERELERRLSRMAEERTPTSASDGSSLEQQPPGETRFRRVMATLGEELRGAEGFPEALRESLLQFGQALLSIGGSGMDDPDWIRDFTNQTRVQQVLFAARSNEFAPVQLDPACLRLYQQWQREVELYQQVLVLRLAAAGARPIVPLPGRDRLNTERHDPRGAPIPTRDEQRHNLVARLLMPGLDVGGEVVRKAVVECYAYGTEGGAEHGSSQGAAQAAEATRTRF